jgi:hypothetical protein
MKLGGLEIGSKVRDTEGEILFLVAAQNHPGYAGTTLIAEKLVELGCYDAAEPGRARENIFIQSNLYGYNDYAISNIHAWLNAGSEGWFGKSHDLDTPPESPYLRYNEVSYSRRNGFLSLFSPRFREAVLEVEVPYLKMESRDKGSLKSVKAKVFLPSRTEMGKGDEHGIPEGKMFPLSYDYSIYKTTLLQSLLDKYGRKINPEWGNVKIAHYNDPQLYDPKFGWWYWLRTANMAYTFLNRVCSPYGALSYTFSYNDVVGIRPVLCLSPDLNVTSNGKYKEIFTIEP